MAVDIFVKLAEQIIKEQENIIGPVALEQAQKVPGIKVNTKTHEIYLEGDKKNILENLVKQYQGLFGRASVQVCKEAAKSILSLLPADQVPNLLR